MIDTDQRIPLITDLTFGVLIVAGLVGVVITPFTNGFMGFLVGISIGYAVYAGSLMADFSFSVADDTSE